MLLRHYVGWFFLLVAVFIWIPSGDLVDLIIRQKEVILGKYSQGHFGGLIFLSLIFLWISALCFSKIPSLMEGIVIFFFSFTSMLASIFLVLVVSGYAVQPRYVEKIVESAEGDQKISGLVRHRPPAEFYQLTQVDKPEHPRSYPDAPDGYPAFDLVLTSDENGFRNQPVNKQVQDSYPIVVVGDSFVAGSHVSDEQVWTVLLSERLSVPIYNMGVSGSDPGNYYNNFMLLGRKLKPKKLLFMIYEGNDFKKVSPLLTELSGESGRVHGDSEAISNREISDYVKASPVIKGLRRLSSEVLQVVGKNRPVPMYAEQVGFMPIAIKGNGWMHHYSFEPKRLMYLYQDKKQFRESTSWGRIALIMSQLVELGRVEGFEVYFLYAPSTPHVVMPLVKNQIPNSQLYNFAKYEADNIPSPEIFAPQFYDWIDNEQEVFESYCRENNFFCLSLTASLREAVAAGRQSYFTYDQHWTPEGNAIVAEQVGTWLLESQSR